MALVRPSVPPLATGLPVTTPLTICFCAEPDHVGVGVHHPRHGLAVGADVGRGDVVLGADVLAERVGEAARDALQLGARDRVRIELDAALATAEGKAHQRRLPRHHRGERLHVVERDLRVEADAALERPEDVVVLDAVALEQAHLAAVHLHGEVDDELILGLAQDGLDVRLDLRDLAGALQVVLHHLVEVVLLARGQQGRLGLGRAGDVGGRGGGHGRTVCAASWHEAQVLLSIDAACQLVQAAYRYTASDVTMTASSRSMIPP